MIIFIHNNNKIRIDIDFLAYYAYYIENDWLQHNTYTGYTGILHRQYCDTSAL